MATESSGNNLNEGFIQDTLGVNIDQYPPGDSEFGNGIGFTILGPNNKRVILYPEAPGGAVIRIRSRNLNLEFGGILRALQNGNRLRFEAATEAVELGPDGTFALLSLPGQKIDSSKTPRRLLPS